MSADVKRRRRGTELEHALLDATWDELLETGYAKLTMESVAARAHTGIAVLYRRWANKDRLVLAAIEHYRGAHPVPAPDTGTLRGDLLAALTGMGEARANYYAIATVSAISGLLTDAGLTPAQARDKVLGGASNSLADAIYPRAHARGEIDLERVPAALLAMPFDLVRHDLFMNLRPPESARIHSIVDDLFMPLIERTCS